MEDRAVALSGPEAAEALKVPPQSVEAEQSVLGGLMLDTHAWDRIADKLTEEDFYRREHRLIYRAIAALIEASSPADVVTVSEWLEKQHELSNAGGLSYLASLANNTPSAANIGAYANIVHERAVLRSLITTANRIAHSAYHTEGRSAADILDFAEKNIFDISEQGAHRRGGFVPIKGLLTKAVDRIDELFRSESAITGISTGFKDLDDMTSGLQPGDLVIVAGRPSMGKTSLAMNIAENAAVGSKTPVAIFSMEMPGEQLAMRMMASLGRINAHKVRTGKLEDDDWPRLTHAIGLLAEAPMYVDDTPALTPLELRTRARRLKREHGLKLIVVDYLQLMQAPESSENRATEISGITRSLKGLAKELGVPLIALSQLNRSLEQRPNKRPVMSDLRESGAIEQDADVIFFIYRDEVYNEDSPEKGTAEIIIGKQRNGPTGKVKLTFLGEYTRFENYTSSGYAESY
ncbi:MAG: replicative DNA helicase [Gammaproteobacteria bacterium]|nr:replicative DNA helicase [Gammaproteobacteria bacterium]